MEKKSRKFDTKVQHLKYKVLREVARRAWNDTLLEGILDIPKTIVPGHTPTMRCCVYKERAILAERVKIPMLSRSLRLHAMNAPSVVMRSPMLAGDVWHTVARTCVSAAPSPLIITMWHTLIKANAWNAAPAPRSVRLPPLYITNVPAKTPAKSRRSPWMKTRPQRLTTTNVSPAAHAFTNVRLARLPINLSCSMSLT